MSPRARFRIPLAAPDIEEGDVEAVVRVLRSGVLSRGEVGESFEAAVAARAGVAHAVAVSSGTMGLSLALLALGVGRGDEVVTSPLSFVAAANAIARAGAVAVFADIDPRTLNLDPERAARAVSVRTRALLVVHNHGRPAAMDALLTLAAARRLAVVEDACEALGAVSGGRPVGSRGDASVFAFYPNKPITTGEGGAIATGSAGLAARLRRLRNQGREPGAAPDGLDQVEPGCSARLADLNAALGLSQLERLDAVLRHRESLARAYRDRLSGLDELELPAPDVEGDRTSWFCFVVRLAPRFEAADRDRVMGDLAARGVECGRYFPPVHLQPWWRRHFGYRRGDFPLAEAAGDRVLALPFHPRLGEGELDEVCGGLRAALRALR